MADKTPETNLLGKVAAAAGKMRNPALDKVNPHYRNRYASLLAVSDAARVALAEQGLAYKQTVVADDGGQMWAVTYVYGAEGVLELSRFPVALRGASPQADGSAMTYAKRYCLQAAFGLVGDDDDDGEAAETPSKPRGASKGTNTRRASQKAAGGPTGGETATGAKGAPTDAEKAELRDITAQLGGSEDDKKRVWAAYKANGIEGARGLLAIMAPQMDLADADIEFGAAS